MYTDVSAGFRFSFLLCNLLYYYCNLILIEQEQMHLG